MKSRSTFILSQLENGNYSVGIAITTGKPDWSRNALTFTAESGYPLPGTVIRLPIEFIACRGLE